MSEVRRLAIVNRGEAAMRCLRTVKALRARDGSDLVAIAFYTESDRDAPYVRHADEAFELSSSNGETAAWLDHETLLRALREARADAAWPGWGFVAESPEFVERVGAQGIAFLGPTPEAMRALGDKIEAKRCAEIAGVPVIPWSGGEVADAAHARAAARRLGYPLALKAASGGGGRGIRMLDDERGLDEALASARAEARTAFGDDRVFLERRVEAGRHIEVQIAGDTHGNVLALGLRDCSVQRRHQKVIEEAPPPGLPSASREALENAAVRLALRVGYTGLGTVEFLVSQGAFHFLEMNPRLQVEHGISETLTGLDLVELQIRIARGESLAGLVPTEHGVAIEARVCAEDPELGFLPAPGRVARFDPALGPRIRIDSGVTAGSHVPAAFDSLVAKVIASGATREEARARLAAALGDFDLVIEGGATNKGWLARVLDHPDFRRGGVDTSWLDGAFADAPVDEEAATLALAAAAILRYQQGRGLARKGFFADPQLSPERIPPSSGQEIHLIHAGCAYQVRVRAVGAWRYRVHLGEGVMTARLREEGTHAARIETAGRTHRLLYDLSEAGARVEVEGQPFRFGFQTAGHVRAGTPAMVVAVHVEAGDVVRAGQRLGLLEAMKMEVGFEAPIGGTVREVRVRRGQQVGAGDVLLLIDPSGEPESDTRAPALAFPAEQEPLAALLRAAHDLALLDATPAPARHAALHAAREVVRRVLLGYDADPDRAAGLADFLEAPLPDDLSDALLWELAEARHELALFGDVAPPFVKAPQASVDGPGGPSNHARFQMYLRRVRAGGAGIAEPFLELVRRALRHYGIDSLEPTDALERAVLRLVASQRVPALRDRLVLGLLRRLAALARAGVHLADDAPLADALDRVASLRGFVSHTVADAALEARYLIFERPRMLRQAERTSKEVAAWLDAARSAPTAPPAQVLAELADAPRGAFEQVGRWVDDPDPRRRAIALAAHARRLYSPERPVNQAAAREGERWVERLELPGCRVVVAGACVQGEVAETAALLVRAAERERTSHEWMAVHAIELLVSPREGAPDPAPGVLAALEGQLPCARFSVTVLDPDGADLHRTFVPAPGGFEEDRGLCGMHPEAAARLGLDRLARFELERLDAPADVYCFAARSRELPSDERIIVLAEVRSLAPDAGHDAGLHLPAFEQIFHDATRALRAHLGLHDPKRRLQWNRLVVDVSPEIVLDRQLVQSLASRLAPDTRNLGLEKVIVRVRLLDRDQPARPAKPLEIVISDVTGQSLTVDWRAPRSEALEPAGDYERRVADARRRRLVYPYEIVRMLSEEHADARLTGAGLPVGTFEEWDLDDSGEAHCVAGRAPGGNGCGIVFGTIRTPTEKVPEGMERVLVLSDPTHGMGSLARAECARVFAAIDLADELGVPVEWVTVSSGARIAMDSGTENLDATARVARRIIEFTQRGGVIHVIVAGVNVGAQSYWNSLATMLMHTRGALVMVEGGSMVLTGTAALAASGSVSAEDESEIGGFERVMGPNGEAQYRARDVADAFRLLYEHYRYTYVVPGESAPRPMECTDPPTRDVGRAPVDEGDFADVGEIFDDTANPGRKRAFPMRSVMAALVDRDGGCLERWGAWVGAETAIVWDAHLGGRPVSLIGIESQSIAREGYRPHDGPASWTGGTLFPLSSKKVARAINAASANRPVIVLANLSGFDGSPESMRKLQLEQGAEIARAVVNFEGPILFLVVSRYHGGAYVVFSQALNPGLRAAALRGSFASVIGGSAAASVVFGREVNARAAANPRVRRLRENLRRTPDAGLRAELDRALEEETLQAQAEIAQEFDAIHSVERARQVGSLEEIVEPAQMRAWLVDALR